MKQNPVENYSNSPHGYSQGLIVGGLSYCGEIHGSLFLLSRAVVNEQFGLFLQTYHENFMSKENTVHIVYRFYGLKKDIKSI